MKNPINFVVSKIKHKLVVLKGLVTSKIKYFQNLFITTYILIRKRQIPYGKNTVISYFYSVCCYRMIFIFYDETPLLSDKPTPSR